MVHPVCPNGHTPAHFLIALHEIDSVTGESYHKYEYAVMLPDGELTNTYDDGTAGLSAEDRQNAEESECAFCPICRGECDWKHGA